jgi:hypothetical protein
MDHLDSAQLLARVLRAVIMTKALSLHLHRDVKVFQPSKYHATAGIFTKQ